MALPAEPAVRGPRPTGMTMRRLGSLVAVAVAVSVLGGCTSGGVTVGSGSDTGSSESTTTSPPDTRPTSQPPDGMTGPGQTVDGARLLYFDVLPVQPGDYPPQIPLAVKVEDVRGLATTYAGTPGIETVVNAVAAISSLTSDDDLYVFVVTPCIVDNAILQVNAKVVTVKLTGTGSGAELRCEPPPVRIAVFAVPSSSVPSSAVPTPPTY